MVVYTDPAAEDEGDLDSGAKTLDHNERIHSKIAIVSAETVRANW